MLQLLFEEVSTMLAQIGMSLLSYVDIMVERFQVIDPYSFYSNNRPLEIINTNSNGSTPLAVTEQTTSVP